MPIQIIDGSTVLSETRNGDVFWPGTAEEQQRRLKPMCLPRLSPSFRFDKQTKIFTVGSCFARNIEKQLLIENFDVAAREFPALCSREGCDLRDDVLNKFCVGSILQELRWALDPATPFDDSAILEVGRDKFIDLHLAPTMIPASRPRVEAVRRAVCDYMKMIASAQVVIITLGLAEAWFDKKHGIYLNRPPLRSAAKAEPGRFEVHVLEYGEIVDALEQIYQLLEQFGHPDFRLILTVSPVALGSTWTDDDALIANCYSKSVQRAAAGYVTGRYERIDYLPSYESITISDRSIAWREDGAHVTDEVVRVNVLRMLHAYTDTDGSPENAQQRVIALQLVKDSKRAQSEKRPEEALRLALLAKEIASQEVAVATQLGVAMLAADDVTGAIAELQLARSLGGGRYGAGEALGHALNRAGRPIDAIPILEEALALDLKWTKAPIYLAESLSALDRKGEALDMLLDALARTKGRKAGLAIRAARLLIQFDRLDEARHWLDRALLETPDNHKLVALRKSIGDVPAA
jgi:tetratricopeptide (TPR) repeat protein